MGFCKIHHIDVIPYAASVRSVVIVSENVQMMANSGSGLSDKRYQILRDSSWQLTDQCGRMRTNRIEISQSANLEVRESYYTVAEYLLSHLLALSVRGEASFQRGILSDGQMLLVWLPVNRAG